jgi:TonB-linked SusC/RagA family outer membrane protein
MMASYTDNNRIKSSGGTRGAGGWAQANSHSLPWMKVYDPNGINGYWNSQSYVNALAGIDPRNSESNLQSLNLISGLTADLKLPVDGLSLHGELGVNYVSSKAESWISVNVRETGTQAEENKIQAITTNYNTYFNFERSFNERHNFSLVAGIEGTRSIGQSTNLIAKDLYGIFHEIGTPGSLSGNSRLGGESYLMGIFGRANYNYNNKYYAGFSMRRDGISKFIKENRWATFLSCSLGLIISEESLFNLEAINFLKLRGSYGQTGNTNIPTGITDDIWDIVSGDRTLQGSNSTQLVNIGNRDIKWETTSTMDIGFDFGILKNRINGSVALYRQRIEDMLLKVSLPQSAGITGTYGNAIWMNVGDMENYGWEVNMDAVVVAQKNFRWSIGGNFSTNRNKVLALDPESDISGTGFTPESDAASDSELRVIIKKGLPLGNWYMSEFAGVDPQKGIPMIYEIETLADGSTRHTGNIIPATTNNYADNRMILDGKSSIPKIVGGFNTNLSYRNFDFNMVWNFSAGHYIYNRLKQNMMTPSEGLWTLSQDLLTNSWMRPGDPAKYPMVTVASTYYYDEQGNPSVDTYNYGSERTPSSLWLEKGDFLRLKNVQVGYNLPDKFCKASHLKMIRIYFSGTNLLTLTKFSGYDPEVEIGRNSISSVVYFSNLPQSRIFSFGISAKF